MLDIRLKCLSFVILASSQSPKFFDVLAAKGEGVCSRKQLIAENLVFFVFFYGCCLCLLVNVEGTLESITNQISLIKKAV